MREWFRGSTSQEASVGMAGSGPRRTVTSQRSPRARRKAQTKQTDNGLAVNSFRTLLTDLATLTRNQVRSRAAGAVTVEFASPTPVQQRAFDLLQVSPQLQAGGPHGFLPVSQARCGSWHLAPAELPSSQRRMLSRRVWRFSGPPLGAVNLPFPTGSAAPSFSTCHGTPSGSSTGTGKTP